MNGWSTSNTDHLKTKRQPRFQDVRAATTGKVDVSKISKESPQWLPLSQSRNYGPNKVRIVTLYSIGNTPNIAKQAIITNSTLAMCHIKPILVP